MMKIQRILTKMIGYIFTAIGALWVVACFRCWTLKRTVIYGVLWSAVIIIIFAKIAIYEVESRV